MCPYCGRDAPLFYNGLAATCTACGKPRIPLTGSALNLAGVPSGTGGRISQVLGWMVLVGGLSVALFLGLFFYWLFPTGVAGLVISLPVAMVSLAIGIALLVSGSKLRRSGESKQMAIRLRALTELAAHRGGVVRAIDAARSLRISVEDADALLTNLAKTRSDWVSVELDDRGQIYYRFATDDPMFRVDDAVADFTNRLVASIDARSQVAPSAAFDDLDDEPRPGHKRRQ